MDWLNQNWVYLLLLCVMFMVSRGRMRGGISNHIPALVVRISVAAGARKGRPLGRQTAAANVGRDTAASHVSASSLSEHLDLAGFPSELQNLGQAFNPEIER